jgi:hypothetical protein
MSFKTPLLKKAAPQFPPISAEEAKAALAAAGFTETPITLKDILRTGVDRRVGYWRKTKLDDVCSKHVNEQHTFLFDNTAGCWDYSNSKSHYGDEGSNARGMLAKMKSVLRKKKEPSAVVLSSWEETQANDGVYYDTNVGNWNTAELCRFTAYCDEGSEEVGEEIDVDAKDETHAKQILLAAVAEDYEFENLKVRKWQVVRWPKNRRNMGPLYD